MGTHSGAKATAVVVTLTYASQAGPLKRQK